MSWCLDVGLNYQIKKLLNRYFESVMKRIWRCGNILFHEFDHGDIKLLRHRQLLEYRDVLLTLFLRPIIIIIFTICSHKDDILSAVLNKYLTVCTYLNFNRRNLTGEYLHTCNYNWRNCIRSIEVQEKSCTQSSKELSTLDRIHTPFQQTISAMIHYLLVIEQAQKLYSCSNVCSYQWWIAGDTLLISI